MNVYRHFKGENFSHLEIDISALYLIAAPSMPEPVRAQVITRAENGEKVKLPTVGNLNIEFRSLYLIAAPPPRRIPSRTTSRPATRSPRSCWW
jgi:hypothetical protein